MADVIRAIAEIPLLNLIVAIISIIALVVIIALLRINIKKSPGGFSVFRPSSSSCRQGLIQHSQLVQKLTHDIDRIEFISQIKDPMTRAEEALDEILDQVDKSFFKYLQQIRPDGTNLFEDQAYKTYKSCLKDARAAIQKHCNRLLRSDFFLKSIKYQCGYEVNQEVLKQLEAEEIEAIRRNAALLFRILPDTLNDRYNCLNPTRQEVMVYNTKQIFGISNPADVRPEDYRNADIYKNIRAALLDMREISRGYYRATREKAAAMDDSLNRTLEGFC